MLYTDSQADNRSLRTAGQERDIPPIQGPAPLRQDTSPDTRRGSCRQAGAIGTGTSKSFTRGVQLAAHKIVAGSSSVAFGAPAPKKGWVHANGPVLINAFRIADATCIVLALRVAGRVLELSWTREQLLLAMLGVTCFMLVASPARLYRSWRSSTIGAELQRALGCTAIAIGCVALPVASAGLDQGLPATMLALWGVLAFTFITAGRISVRLGLRHWRASGRNFRTAIVVGANDVARALAQQLQARPWMGIQLVGVARSVDDYRSIKAQHPLDVVYIALPLGMHRQIRTIVDEARDSATTVMYVPDFSAYGPLRSTWGELGDMLTVSLVDTPHQGTEGALKRVLDIVFASAALVGLALPMLAIAAAIKLTSPGPAIFAQKRYGLDGKSFRIYKFRTMRDVEDGESRFTQASRCDRRVTPLGAFLRKTSLDELPQLFNVVAGDMSLVGPRPHPVALNEVQRKLIDGYMLRHKVKPGITGLAQVNGFRGETDSPEKMQQRVRFDLEYINTWSLGLDVRILWRTLFVIFHDPNAY